MDILKRLNKKVLIVATLGCFIGLTMSFFSLNSSASKLSSLNNLSYGVNTCMARVSQSFSSLALGVTNAQSLSNEFMAKTSDCFEEVYSYYKTKFAKQHPELGTAINSLVSENYWFSEKTKKAIENRTVGAIAVTESVFMDKFSKIEKETDAIYTRTDGLSDAIYLKSETATLWIKILAVASLIFSLLLLLSSYLAGKTKNIIEKAAGVYAKKENLDDSEISQFIQDSFHKLGLNQSSLLYQRFYAGLIDKKSSLMFKIDNQHILTNKKKTKNLDVLDVNECFNVALEKVKQKAFTHGVIVDFQLDNESFCYGKSDALEQVVFSILNSAIDASLIHNQGRRVLVRGRNLGGVYYLKSTIANYRFENDEISYVDGGPVDDQEIDINLSIMKEMMIMMGGRVNLLNNRSETGEVESGTIELVLNRSEEKAKTKVVDTKINKEKNNKKPELRSLVKGKKKDLEKEFARQLEL